MNATETLDKIQEVLEDEDLDDPERIEIIKEIMTGAI